MLVVCWAILKCHTFLAGLQQFQLFTDHNPLIPILNSHRLDEIENPQLQRLRTRIMGYNFTAQWLKGSNNHAPDALFKNPVSDPSHHDVLAEIDVLNQPELSISEIRATTTTVYTTPCLDTLRKIATKEDAEYQQLQQLILNGFSDHRSQLLDSCKRYWAAVIISPSMMISLYMDADCSSQSVCTHKYSVNFMILIKGQLEQNRGPASQPTGLALTVILTTPY